METTTRYIIQIKIGEKGWEAYRGRRGAGYTLTPEESIAHSVKLPSSMVIRTKVQTTPEDKSEYSWKYAETTTHVQYRVIESMCTDGLISQKVVY